MALPHFCEQRKIVASHWHNGNTIGKYLSRKTLCMPWMFQAHYIEIWNMWEANLETWNLKKLKSLGFQFFSNHVGILKDKQNVFFSENIWKIIFCNQIRKSRSHPMFTILEHSWTMLCPERWCLVIAPCWCRGRQTNSVDHEQFKVQRSIGFPTVLKGQ